jgi:preprotein translocase subunit SecG
VIYLLYALHILVCVFLILVVLLQQGKGADLSVFGGGSTQTAFGARGATTLLHKLTVASFVIFILTTVSIGVFQGKAGNSSVVSGISRTKGKATLPAPVPVTTPAAPIAPTPPNTPGTPAPQGTAKPAAPAPAQPVPPGR